MKVADYSSPRAASLAQVAALPLKFDEDGTARILLLTSRETRRWIIPKGWPMKGRTPSHAAQREALEEAGVVGRTESRPIGTYSYFKRFEAHFEICHVDVYLMYVERRLKRFREKGQRKACWVTLDEAAELVQEPGLIALIRRVAHEREKVAGKKGATSKRAP